jgi:hypothetical protein
LEVAMDDTKNLVDERFELTALIFRLTGLRSEFDEVGTDYQREIATFFANFSEHPAVKLARTFDGKNGIFVGYDAVVKFAVHIKKEENRFVFIDDINSMFDSGRWNESAAQEFLPLFNEFYIDTNYSDFYNSHIHVYEKITQKYIEESYRFIDFEWFKKHTDLSNLRCIFTPSCTRYEFSATVNNKIIYAIVTKNGSAIIHEYCHSFGNSLAHKLYNENVEFRKWCDDSVDTEKMPYYNNGWAISGEYGTRAYNIMYCCQCNGEIVKDGITYKWSEFAPLLMANDFKKGFVYIGEVYNSVINIEKNQI